MLLAILLMGAPGHFPLPAEGAPPVAIQVQVAPNAQDDPELTDLVDKLRLAIGRDTHHVQQVEDGFQAKAIFVISAYDVAIVGGDRERHHITGRYYIKGEDPDGEPFAAWAGAGTRPGTPQGLGRFVESLLYGEAAANDDLAHRSERIPDLAPETRDHRTLEVEDGE
jgi:hypothetical protein